MYYYFWLMVPDRLLSISETADDLQKPLLLAKNRKPRLYFTVTQIISNWILQYDNEFTALK